MKLAKLWNFTDTGRIAEVLSMKKNYFHEADGKKVCINDHYIYTPEQMQDMVITLSNKNAKLIKSINDKIKAHRHELTVLSVMKQKYMDEMFFEEMNERKIEIEKLKGED